MSDIDEAAQKIALHCGRNDPVLDDYRVVANAYAARLAEAEDRSCCCALAAELALLKRAAWDLHDDVSAMLCNNEAKDGKAIRKVLDTLGELLPAHRPEVKP